MTFTPPVLNVNIELWALGTPNTNPPDYTTLAQVYISSRMVFGARSFDPFLIAFRVEAQLYQSIGLPLVGGYIRLLDTYGNQWWYFITAWEYVHMGFPNEYTEVLAYQCDQAGAYPDPLR